jgi:predicted phosphodiesterase
LSNVLVIGDLHEPFCLAGYLEFCQEQYRKCNCDQVVFIGDIIDNHATSYHEDDSQAKGGADELELSIQKVARWRDAFPVATVIIGNHDRMVMRKAQSSKIPTAWIRNYKDVLNVPDWNFVEEYEIDGVQYLHGEGKTAKGRASTDMMSTVQGHRHTEFYCQFMVGKRDCVFGVQVGCGIDRRTYAMAYAKHFPKPAIGCAVIVDGFQPITIPMDLGTR